MKALNIVGAALAAMGNAITGANASFDDFEASVRSLRGYGGYTHYRREDSPEAKALKIARSKAKMERKALINRQRVERGEMLAL